MSNKFRRRAKKLSIRKSRAKKARANYPDLCQLSLFDGIASVIDWKGILAEKLRGMYCDAQSPEELDARAIANDWRLVGQDLYAVIWDHEQRKTAEQTTD